jgi:hypothetical protein
MRFVLNSRENMQEITASVPITTLNFDFSLKNEATIEPLLKISLNSKYIRKQKDLIQIKRRVTKCGFTQ